MTLEEARHLARGDTTPSGYHLGVALGLIEGCLCDDLDCIGRTEWHILMAYAKMLLADA